MFKKFYFYDIVFINKINGDNMTAIAGFKSIQSSNQSNQAKRRGNDPEFNTISDLASQLLYLKINEKSISKAVKLEEDYDALVKKVNDCVSAFTQKCPQKSSFDSSSGFKEIRRS
ncbi:MAG: hypothetical protein HWD61_06675 [Parachlamydiaceae bacterium]|nr:MAG: hypothetical protein HWD61_06675 [Parachlamydiaceae bacterium]